MIKNRIEVIGNDNKKKHLSDKKLKFSIPAHLLTNRELIKLFSPGSGHITGGHMWSRYFLLNFSQFTVAVEDKKKIKYQIRN